MQDTIKSVEKALKDAGYTTVRTIARERGAHTIVELQLAPSSLLDKEKNFAAIGVLQDANLYFDSVTDFGDLLIIRDVATVQMMDDRERAIKAAREKAEKAKAAAAAKTAQSPKEPNKPAKPKEKKSDS